MTLTQTVNMMETAASGMPGIHSIVRNDIFRLNTLPDAEYAVFGWTQGQHSTTIDSSLITYNFTLFYIDRLTHDLGNQLEIQSAGIQVLDNIIRTLDNNGVFASSYTFTTFNQRFLDECAGVFTSASFQVPVEGLCADTYNDFSDDFNEDFATGSSVTIY